jgi:ankyrin repeat protein
MVESEEEQAHVAALVKAAYDGRMTEVTRLVEARPVLMDRWDFLRRSFNALMAAAEENQLEVIRYLVGRGARLNLQSGSGWTPLMYAADRGHDEIVTFLLESGADATVCGKDGRTALILASSNYYAVGSVKILLDWKRQDVDARDSRGATALWWASYWANFEAIKHLLAGGADQTIADAKGRTPKQIARKEGHDGCVGLIEVRQDGRY